MSRRRCMRCNKMSIKWERRGRIVTCYDNCKYANGIIGISNIIPKNGDKHSKKEIKRLVSLGYINDLS